MAAEGGKGGGVGPGGVVVVPDRLLRKEGAAETAHMVHGVGMAVAAEQGGDCFKERAGDLIQPGIPLRMLRQQIQLGQPRGHGHRVAAEGSGLIHLAQGGDHIHHIPAAAVGAHGHTRADDLAEGGEVRADAEEALGAVDAQPEAGDHLVKNQQGAVFVAQLPQPGEKALLRRNHAHIGGHRLHQHRGDLAGVGLKQGFDAFQVVVNGGEGVGGAAGGHTCAAGHAGGHHAGAGFHQQTVAVAVIAAIELYDLAAAGKAPGGPDGAHHRLGAGVHHPHHLNGGNQLADSLRHHHLDLRGGAVAQAPGAGVGHRLPDLGPVVAQNHGTPGADVVNVGLAVGIGHIGAVGGGDEPGGHANGAKGPDGAVYAAGNHPSGPVKQFFAASHQPILPS